MWTSLVIYTGQVISSRGCVHTQTISCFLLQDFFGYLHRLSVYFGWILSFLSLPGWFLLLFFWEYSEGLACCLGKHEDGGGLWFQLFFWHFCPCRMTNF